MPRFNKYLYGSGITSTDGGALNNVLRRLLMDGFKNTLNMNNLRVPKLEHDLIECSVCHKLIEEPNIDECEFCNEDVCDDCWDKHLCEPYDYAEVL